MVPTPAARMACKIQCHLTAAQRQLDAGQLDEAVSYLPRIVDLVHRGIQCGAMIDPWNILGFDANFSLFPAVENTVHDHRADELNELMEEIFALYSRAWCLAAAANAQEAVQTLAKEFRELATWWDQFAVVTVTSVDGVAAGLLYDAAEAAAAALSAWNEAGTQAGDTAFWQPHVDQFESPKAYVLVLSALIDQRDFVASMGVLIHWLNHADEVGLQRGTDLFQVVATLARRAADHAGVDAGRGRSGHQPRVGRRLAARAQVLRLRRSECRRVLAGAPVRIDDHGRRF